MLAKEIKKNNGLEYEKVQVMFESQVLSHETPRVYQKGFFI